MAMSWIGPSISATTANISIPEQWLDDPERVRNVYAVWLFRKLFGLVDNPPWLESQSRLVHIAASLFACYYRSSFVNQNVCAHDWIGRSWNNGLWNIRVKRGQDFADRTMFATYKAWAWVRPEKSEDSFDEFFSLRFLNGLSLVDPARRDLAEVQDILRGQK